ncbi:N-6 DNA methylase [Methylobacter sp.]|uniref:N-6 DNA methylase n=1 Tax=Methylobacter sp. TaxID=2051955 RepID=UPI003DA25835
MQLSHHAKTSDPLGRYYTEPKIGALLVEAMGLPHPTTVLDLGSGDGSLVGEAAKIWTSARFITVDIDANAASSMLPNLRGSAFKHHTIDALDIGLAARLGLKWGEADAALCNPPYIRHKWKKQFAEILEDAGLSHVLPRLGDVPADLLFLAQNLRLLRTAGRLGLILPDSIVSGEKFTVFRKTLIQEHSVERVIELPRRIFRNTDAKAYIVIVAKYGKGSDHITVQRLEADGILSAPYLIPAASAVKRFDYSYLAKNVVSNETRKIGDETIFICRGSFSSSFRKSVGFPIFHTSDFSADDVFVPSSFNLPKECIADSCVVAEPGDILVARVGRNLSQKVCMVRKGRVVISDCLLLLRVNEGKRNNVFSFLRSSTGRLLLDASAHGVGAKFITTKSLLELPF